MSSGQNENWFSSGPGDDRPRKPQARQPNRANPSDAEVLDAYSQAVIRVVEAVSPAVISIVGEGRGSGSGFLISADGIAITNSHVVDGRDQLIAETDDGDRVEATVIGDDPATDIALLWMSASDLPFSEIGDSEALRVGQLVIAIGSPLGLQSTVSTGVVSSCGRSLRGQDGRLIENVVQHSAPINPGNSGGPLVDSHGRVVGVNTAIIVQAQGLGFAVPSNTAQWVTNEILTNGTVRRRQLGIAASAERISRGIVRELDLFSDQVVHVVEVAPSSVADRSGIRQGDSIVAINDRIISGIDDVHRLLALAPPEMPLDVTIVRGRDKFELRMSSE